MYTYFALAALAYFLYRFFKWFFRPYYEYKDSLKSSKELLFIENGEIKKFYTEPILTQSKDESSYDLTIIVPAYNEFDRLPKMMTETLQVSHPYLNPLLVL
jgi:hypothetical protein